jgi:hypothetical protein
MSGDDQVDGERPRHYRGRRRDLAFPTWGLAIESPRLVFLAVLAVAVCVVIAVSALGSGGSPPLLLDPAPTAPVPTSPSADESESVEPRPDTSRPARSSTRPSPGSSPTRSATANPTPSEPPVGVTPGPTPAPSTYEAEAAALGTGPRVRDQSGASGGKVVGSVGNGAAATLRFVGVRALSGGRYTLTIYYLSGESRSASIKVNDGGQTMLAFTSTGGFNRVGSRTFNVDLVAGTNTIEFSNSTNWAPDFDRIVV